MKSEKIIDRWTNRINNELNENLSLLESSDRRKLVAKLKALGPSVQAEHVFREIVLGAHFARRGYCPRYEFPIGDQTPDWFLTVSSSQAIVDVVNVDPASSLTKQLHVCTLSFVGDRSDLLWSRVTEKASKYRVISIEKKLPLVIAICPNFAASIEEGDVVESLFNAEWGVFSSAPYLSGCLLYESLKNGAEVGYADHWKIRYAENPGAPIAWNRLP